jgi:hypothetical protein
MSNRRTGAEPIPGAAATPGQPDIQGAGLRDARSQGVLVRVLPVALLIILGLAGLHGAVSLGWDGPLHRDVAAVGGALEVVLGTLLVLTLRRRSAYLAAQRASRTAGRPLPFDPIAVKLRWVLIFLLGSGMVAVAVVVDNASEVTGKPVPVPQFGPPHHKLKPKHLSNGSRFTFHIPVTALLYTLFVVGLLAAVAVSVWWARRLQRSRSSGVPRDDDFIAFEVQDPGDLRDALGLGRSALRTLDDARTAIVACYLAMENSLAERGTAQGVADTPDELLARATRTGLVYGTAAARLTGLFYEARFSSHPLDRGQRDEAEQALDELAAALATPVAPEHKPGGASMGSPG